MERLINYSKIRLNKTSIGFLRYLYKEINWDDRLIGIKGFRGVGKSTLMLQRLKTEYGNSGTALYISLDHFYFVKNSLYEFAEQFYLNGGRMLFIDEVHRYPGWSLEIKNLYDLHDDLKIVFSGSSALQIHKADGDLSRRAAIYNLHELSFAEYLELSGNGQFMRYKLEDVLKKHETIAAEITAKTIIIPLFRKYLHEGVYPFFREVRGQFYDRLATVINIIIERDLQIFENINYSTAHRLRQLVAVLADTVPYKVNITKLSRIVGLSRDKLIRMLSALDRVNLIKNLHYEGSATGYFTKPDKIYLNNTALLYALNAGDENIEGTVRETFFMNQLLKSHKVKCAKAGDFMIDSRFIFEVGGKGKKFNQIAGLKHSFIAADNLELGYGNKIPLWLFGFLY